VTRQWVRVAAFLCSCLWCEFAFGETAIVQQPRPFGYVLGDTLNQRVLLQSAGRNFDPVALPPIERAGLWFTRRSARIEVDEHRRPWAILEYQVINAPQALMTVNLPSVTLEPKTGNHSLVVPEWPISIAALTPQRAFAKGGLQELRADHPAPMIPIRGLLQQLEVWGGALALTIVAWLSWWSVRSWRSATHQPFARASREIRLLSDDSTAAWLALHAAFDRTAQRALQLSTLPALFERAPHFAAQKPAIERFYAESYARFFGVGMPEVAGTSAPTSPRALCTLLRRIEKQHER
jgi:mxaA protein